MERRLRSRSIDQLGKKAIDLVTDNGDRYYL
jgi:hypothetical protein